MLATTSTTPYMFPTHHNAFLPATPSPLSPRSANIYGPRQHFTFMSSNENEKAKQKKFDFSQRAVKKAPSPKPDELKEQRRKLFLRKVKEGREERRFEGRREDMMRLDFMQRRKQWEAELAREAPRPLSFDGFYEYEEDENHEQEQESDLPGWNTNDEMLVSYAPSTQQQQQQPWLEDEADEAMRRENAELEVLLSYMPVDDGPVETSEHLYSDDDDYDALFSELMEQGEELSFPNHGSASQQEQEQQQTQGEAMDMS